MSRPLVSWDQDHELLVDLLARFGRDHEALVEIWRKVNENHDKVIAFLAAFGEFRIALGASMAKLNELRTEVTSDRIMYLRVDVFDARFETLQKTEHERDNRFEARIGSLEMWRSKAIGAILAMTTVGGIIGASAMAIIGHFLR